MKEYNKPLSFFLYLVISVGIPTFVGWNCCPRETLLENVLWILPFGIFMAAFLTWFGDWSMRKGEEMRRQELKG